ncbi:MAG: hypothetical protein ILM98_13965 [Kiritimatiellae bacterium]|nr:hypothetical protein [Kiritimatiellia bacterium]
MNWPETIEKALRDTFAAFAPAEFNKAWLRCEQDQADRRNPTASQMFPQVLLRCSSPYPESEGATWACDIDAVCATWAEDDPGFRVRSRLYGAAETFFMRLAEFRSFKTPNEESAAFVERMAIDEPRFHLGGFTVKGGEPHSVAEGVVAAAPFSTTIHFSIDGD